MSTPLNIYGTDEDGRRFLCLRNGDRFYCVAQPAPKSPEQIAADAESVKQYVEYFGGHHG